jgi:hypothetical protein
MSVNRMMWAWNTTLPGYQVLCCWSCMVTFQEWTHLSDDTYQAVWLGVHLYLTVFSYTPATHYGGCGVSKSSFVWIRAKHNTPQMILSNNVLIVWTDVFEHIAMFRYQSVSQSCFTSVERRIPASDENVIEQRSNRCGQLGTGRYPMKSV